MNGNPLVSVITPTWQRHDFLLDRCVPSVAAQTYPYVEHVVVSDGPDPDLSAKLPCTVIYDALPVHDVERHWGIPARLHALNMTLGEFVTYCDDDDLLRPGHCEVLVKALLDNPECGFALSQMMSHQPTGDHVIGQNPVGLGQVGTPMIMHRREILDVATWGRSNSYEDWDLVATWIGAGIKFARVDQVTIDVWPSTFR